MARLDRQSALAEALQELGFELGGHAEVPRYPGVGQPEEAWIIQAYRDIGGVQSAPNLRPRGWDICTTSGLVVELDEEQHFNRYRAATLNLDWAVDLPWREEYLAYCSNRERDALRTHSGGGFWQGPVSMKQFGSAGPRGNLDGLGSPRWKQRALYDAMRDASAAAGRVRLARLSVHDVVGGVPLGSALRNRVTLDHEALRTLLSRRTSGQVETNAPRVSRRPSVHDASRGETERAGDGDSMTTASPAISALGASADRTFEPAELARMLGHDNESRPGKVVRDYLRRRYPSHPKGQRWVLDDAQAADVLANVPRNA